MLLPELLGEIANHVENIVVFASVCRLWQSVSTNQVTLAYVKHFAKTVPKIVLDAFGGIEAIVKYPILKIDRCGDYIDFVNNDMMKGPIMIGICPYKRRFFCLRYFEITKQRLNVVVIFQRYTDPDSRWNGAGHYNFDYVFDTSYKAIDYDLLKDLVDGKEVTITVSGNEKLIKLC